MFVVVSFTAFHQITGSRQPQFSSKPSSCILYAYCTLRMSLLLRFYSARLGVFGNFHTHITSSNIIRHRSITSALNQTRQLHGPGCIFCSPQTTSRSTILINHHGSVHWVSKPQSLRDGFGFENSLGLVTEIPSLGQRTSKYQCA